MADLSFRPRSQGKILEDAVTVFLNGRAFHSWESVSVTKNLDNVINSFSLDVDNRFSEVSQEWPIKPGTRVAVNIGKERVITGFIDSISVDYAADSRGFSASGRSRSADLVDCSVSGKTEFSSVKFEDVVSQLISPFGMEAFYSVTPKQVEKFGTKPGESVFTALDRLARIQGFLWVSTRNGNIRLTRAGRARAASEISQDVNLLGGSISFNNAERFSEYKVLGQKPGTDEFNGLLSASPVGTSKDNGIDRFRPLTIIAESPIDDSQAKERAGWEASVRIGQSFLANVTVQGWRQRDGSIWGINQLVRFKSKFFGIDQDLLISSVTHTRSSSSGTLTSMDLVRKDSFQVKPVYEKEDDLLSQFGL